MSAYLVEDDHLCLMVQGAVQRHGHAGNLAWYWKRHAEDSRPERFELSTLQEDADRVVGMLYRENVKSVSYRYRGELNADPTANGLLPGDDAGVPTYRRAFPHGHIDPVWVLKAIDCYRYQACEHPDWEASEAFAFCAALEHRMVSQLPGYDDAPTWSYSRAGLERYQVERRAAGVSR